MSKFNPTVTLPEQTRRSPMLVALLKRHGQGVKSHKDRRLPRGGNRNDQRDFREERY